MTEMHSTGTHMSEPSKLMLNAQDWLTRFHWTQNAFKQVLSAKLAITASVMSPSLTKR